MSWPVHIYFMFCFSSLFWCHDGFADLIEEPSEDVPASTTPQTGKKNESPTPNNLMQDDRPSNQSPANQKQKTSEPSQVSRPTTQEQRSGDRRTPDKSERNRNPDAPIKFESQNLQGTKDGGVIVLDKDVLVTQDDLKITADKATIKVNSATNEVLEVLAVGNVHFSRKDPDTGQPVTSESKEAVFNNAARTVVLKGDPKMVRGTDVVRGRQIIYDLNTGWVKATRVEGVVQPNRNPEPKKPTEGAAEKPSVKAPKNKPDAEKKGGLDECDK